MTLSTGDLLRYGFLPTCEYGAVRWANAFGNQVYVLHLTVEAGVVKLWQAGHVVRLESMSLHFGGLRWWFLCPKCNRRCAKVHLLNGGFTCRVCADLAYQSQRLHRGWGFLARILSQKKGRLVSQPEVERACMKMRREQRQSFVRKRDRRPDYQPLNRRRQEHKRQAGRIWLGD